MHAGQEQQNSDRRQNHDERGIGCFKHKVFQRQCSEEMDTLDREQVRDNAYRTLKPSYRGIALKLCLGTFELLLGPGINQVGWYLEAADVNEDEAEKVFFAVSNLLHCARF